MSCEAGVWRDDFNDGKANGWTPFSDPPFTYEERDGVLEFRVLPNPHTISTHFLEWTAVSFEADSLTVMATLPVQKNLNFGIALGKHISREIFGPFIECYIFRRANSVKGVYKISAWAAGFSARAGKAPQGKLGETIEHIKIVFETGRFRMFSGNDLMADFKDEDFRTIDAVGIYTITSEGVEQRGQIDDFVISGPSIPDRKPFGKLVMTWGHLKKVR